LTYKIEVKIVIPDLTEASDRRYRDDEWDFLSSFVISLIYSGHLPVNFEIVTPVTRVTT
jgi:hypothetical protein